MSNITSKKPYFEIRKNSDDTIDEIVAGHFPRPKRKSRGTNVHLEQMDRDCWSLIIGLNNGKRLMVSLYTKRKAAIHVTAFED